ncbi:hypothetical protein JHK87_018075 [Glycine soja]|nr:hypothetical protein JHK87_018075 [Glycine soja]
MEHGKTSAATSLEMVVLRDYIDKEDATIKIGAIMGLGIAYLGVCDEEITFNVFESMNQLKDEEPCSRVDVLDEVVVDTKKQLHNSSPLEKVLIDAFEDLNNEEENGIEECLSSLDGLKEIPPHKVNMKEMKVENKIEKVKNELSMLSPSLKCVSFKEDVEKQVVMSNSLSKVKKRRLKFLDLSRMRLHIGVLEAAHEFALELHELWEMQDEVQRQRIKVEYLRKDFEKQLICA